MLFVAFKSTKTGFALEFVTEKAISVRVTTLDSAKR